MATAWLQPLEFHRSAAPFPLAMVAFFRSGQDFNQRVGAPVG